ncbi:hypothetical protein [uncultured Subdoligranulum sp.]|uniref:hypothetical protein n=1 Tax=uncultured Subdoligranulum sp. TaxID=512298 RepID=UPI002611FD6D|nr:hypothetical protein [uncultured Subdoligranulum sp.]
MKRPATLALALALGLSLAACGSPRVVTVTPEDAATPAPQAETTAARPAALQAGDFYAVSEYDSGFSTGDAWYSLENHLGYCLVTRTDYATATRQVLCSVPGCAHDSETCPAWLPGKGTTAQLFTAGDNVYIYHKVATMHYEGSWDDYYAEVVEPKLKERPQGWEDLTNEELVTFCRGQYGENTAPAGLCILAADGSARREVTASQDLLNVRLRWCDGAALYGYDMEAAPAGQAAGYRLDLADGTVTTFPLQDGEQIAGAQGGNLLTCRTITQVPVTEEIRSSDEAYQAILQNATVEYDWLDPATGTRSKVLEQPHDGTNSGNRDFCGLCGGRLIFAAWEDDAFRAYDPATGQWQDLVRPIPDETMYLPDVTVAALPDAVAQQGRYLWFSGSNSVNGENLAWVLDTQSGELTAVQQTVERELPGWAVRAAAFTDDGRFLVQTAQQESQYGTTPVYGLIDAEAFLQGSTDYTPVTIAE